MSGNRVFDLHQACKQRIQQESERPGPQGYTAAELLKQDFPAPKFITANLPIAANLLAARMKTGKSYFCLNLAIAVATGGKYLGKFDVDQGPVLYLDLELPDRKCKIRLENCLSISGRNDPGLNNLFIYPRGSWPRMGEGGITKLNEFVREHGIKLLIVDTFGLFQPARPAKDQFSYSLDYQDIGKIKDLSEKHGVCVILVMHLNKSWKMSESPFDSIFGSTGLTGAADNLFALTRCSGESEADLLLWGRGRDIDDFKYAIKRCREDYSFQYLGDSVEFELEESQRLIYRTLSKLGREMTPAEIAAALEKNVSTVQNLLIKMELAGIVKKISRGHYKL